MASRIDPRLLALLLLAACNPSAPAPPSTTADSANPIQVADPELFAVCDSLERWTRAAGGRDVHRSDGQFTGAVRPLPRWGCQLVMRDTLTADSTARPLDLVRTHLTARNWSIEQDFVAESSEGTMVGLRNATLVCVLQHYWNADTDDERAAATGERYAYNLELECFRDAPRPPR